MSVYFIQVGDKGPVKIGWSANPVRRLAGFQTAHHEKLYLRGTATGSAQTEVALHKELSQHHIYGEWFQPHEDVFAKIDTPHADLGDVTSGIADAAKLLAMAASCLKAGNLDSAWRMLDHVGADVSLALERIAPHVTEVAA